jgi:hypothetical protein
VFLFDLAGLSVGHVRNLEGMADPFGSTLPTAGDWRIWEKDRGRVEQEIVEGRPFQVWDTERGRFDAMFDFMLRSGLWAAATGMRPAKLKKDNGIHYSLLNGVECLREMAGIDVLANCGPLLKDPYLLERIRTGPPSRSPTTTRSSR